MEEVQAILTIARNSAISSLLRFLGIMDVRVNLIPTAMITEAAIIQVSKLTTGPRLDAVIASRLSIFLSTWGRSLALKVGKASCGVKGEQG